PSGVTRAPVGPVTRGGTLGRAVSPAGRSAITGARAALPGIRPADADALDRVVDRMIQPPRLDTSEPAL
ncbi:MAG: hypothetical protein KDK70_06820, partial [Myxococcales bacterium]|nr:hypothetical protein [Myxococcales bacterium]